MHLASISSQDENDKLEKYIKDFGKNTINARSLIVVVIIVVFYEQYKYFEI